MNMKKKVFIDGSAGTTGLRIRERLAERDDLEVVVLADDVRKDVESRRTALNSADVAFLCLPDAAAVEAVSLVENPGTVVIDTSTAHRTADGWAYGFPELAMLPGSLPWSSLLSAMDSSRTAFRFRRFRSPAIPVAERR